MGSVSIAVIVFLLSLSASIAVFNFDRVKECLSKATEGKKWRKKQDILFHLHFGEPAVEIFNVLSLADIKTVEYLALCVKEEDSQLFENASIENDKNRDDWHFGAGNITHLNGIFRSAVPDILTKIVAAARKTAEDLTWLSNFEFLGLRTVRVVSFKSAQSLPSKDAILANTNGHGSNKEGYKLLLSTAASNENVTDADLLADNDILRNLRKDIDSSYTLIVLLSDRDKFYGGDILVRKTANHLESVSSFDLNTDYYDDENDGDNHENSAELHKFSDRSQLDDVSAGHSVMTSAIGRYYPEQGNMVMIKSEVDHGTDLVTHGERSVLILELWPYADAPLGARRLSLADAKAISTTGPGGGPDL